MRTKLATAEEIMCILKPYKIFFATQLQSNNFAGA